MTQSLKILGIETSCDETAVAVVTDTRQILSSITLSQIDLHSPYGGVVPELSARAHIETLPPAISQALSQAGLSCQDLDGIAATAGPGLIGGVLVGTMAAKAMAAATNLPFMAINHLEGHALTARLTDAIPFPYLLLLTSGGHCQFFYIEALDSYRVLGGTKDDAAGECFDKVARLLGCAYPGGPKIEELARTGNPHAFDLPRPLKGRSGCDFSFSGLKTAARVLIQREENKTPAFKADMAASLQLAITECFEDRLIHAIRQVNQPDLQVVLSGGVAANQFICQRLKQLCENLSLRFTAPPLKLCTDNAAMIAWAGVERLKQGLVDGLDFTPRPRWPLSEKRGVYEEHHYDRRGGLGNSSRLNSLPRKCR